MASLNSFADESLFVCSAWSCTSLSALRYLCLRSRALGSNCIDKSGSIADLSGLRLLTSI
eukprot:5673039-Pleurochrysis_carterae.AAC.1